MSKMKCPTCGTEMKQLVPGIQQCPKCKKIIKDKTFKKKEVEEETELKSGEWFMKNTAINKKYEIAEKGIIVNETEKVAIGLVICHSTLLPSDKYIRISWFKMPLRLHKGMMKITSSAELSNLLTALTSIDNDFDESFNRIKRRTKEEILKDSEDEGDILEFLAEFDGKTCPKCHSRMKKSRNHKYLNCQVCGEVVVLEDGNPIFDIPTDKLPLSYSGNFPVNYYMPAIGITIKWIMGEWKAIVIIYAKENPDKRWLRFYWWTRNLQEYISSKYRADVSTAKALAWTARRGAGSTNVYDKEVIKNMIKGLKKIKQELDW
ncbi:MAG: hypothetical protein GF364_17080 [Candidatus Lokiarchaeota archaeon]|nr:hypothetical protein [Candidatus Lokiarchaeota archaeon]